MKRFVKSSVPNTFASNCFLIADRDKSSSAPGCPYPALFTTAPNTPCDNSSTSFAAYSTESGSTKTSLPCSLFVLIVGLKGFSFVTQKYW